MALPFHFSWGKFVVVSFSLTSCCPHSQCWSFPLYVNFPAWLPFCHQYSPDQRWTVPNCNPPPLHTHTTLIDLGLTPKTPSDWFVTHHWSPALGCDHPSHSNSVSSAPGLVTLALREPKDLVFPFWWPVQCLPFINTLLTVDVRWICTCSVSLGLFVWPYMWDLLLFLKPGIKIFFS